MIYHMNINIFNPSHNMCLELQHELEDKFAALAFLCRYVIYPQGNHGALLVRKFGNNTFCSITFSFDLIT